MAQKPSEGRFGKPENLPEYPKTDKPMEKGTDFVIEKHTYYIYKE